MRASGYALTAALLVAAPSAQSREFDNSTITCAAFLGSGEANMAALISWLRGYHAGKTGIIPFESPSPYGARLGAYCRQHPSAHLIDASEQILAELGRGP
jgi:hypothetical protein